MAPIPRHTYNPFPFERPATSRNNKKVVSRNDPVASDSDPVTSRNHKLVDASNNTTRQKSNVHTPRPALPSGNLRPTGAYPGQFAPLTKRTSLPPPGEMTQHAEENLRAAETREARRAAERKAERKARKETKKQISEEVKSKDAENDGKGGDEAEGQSKDGIVEQEEKRVAADKEKKKRKAKTPKTPGLIQVLEMQSRVAGYEVSKTGELTYIPFTSRFVSMKVQRSRRQRQQEAEAPENAECETLGQNEKSSQRGEDKKKTIFPFLKLPETVKIRIYKLLVVETKLCIWPSTKAGREQPDISMVCKEIRRAVLPIYYGENTFAVDIAPSNAPAVVKKTGSAPAREPLTGLVAVQKWAEVLSTKHNEGGKWFGMVRNWCFSYRDPLAGFGGRGTVPGTVEGKRDFIVNVQVSTKRDSTVDDGEAGGVRQSARAGPIVEVHREAACIMPGWSDCGRCMVQTTPEILVVAIQNWLRSDRKASEGLEELVLEMRKMVDGLPAACCTRTPPNGERPVLLP